MDASAQPLVKTWPDVEGGGTELKLSPVLIQGAAWVSRGCFLLTASQSQSQEGQKGNNLLLKSLVKEQLSLCAACPGQSAARPWAEQNPHWLWQVEMGHQIYAILGAHL